MKTIMTAGMILSLLVTSANANPPEQTSNGDHVVEQHEKNIGICKQNLLAIGKAAQDYEKEHGDFPVWLSDLHPKYLADTNTLLCPADKTGGKPIMSQNTDPKMPVSYSYELNPKWRDWKTEQRTLYGDAMPLLRCRHHANEDFQVLNLSFSSRVYQSNSIWERQPEAVYESLDEAIAALKVGLQQNREHKGFFYVYPMLVNLNMQTGQREEAESLVNLYKKVMSPDSVQDHFVLGNMLEEMDRNEDVLELYETLEKQHPEDRSVHQKLAQLHGELAKTHSKKAAAYQRKADPSPQLIGKPVQDFSATDLNGNPISLQQYRGKVVLLDFWAVWCTPCIKEMPNVIETYKTYKDEGFDIIGISLDTDEAKLRDYLKENNIPWRQIFSGKGWESPVSQQYNIRGIPAPWLIARDGTLISTRARGIALKQMVADALNDKSADQ